MPPSPEQDDDHVRRSDPPRRDSHSPSPINSEKGEAAHSPSILELTAQGEYSENSVLTNDFFAPESMIEQFTPIPEASYFDPVGQAVPPKLKQKM
jgi:hypothetical protein